MKKISAVKNAVPVALAAAMAVTGGTPVLAASSADADNNTATKNDLDNSDIIDMSQKGSITIRKYDMTSAKKDKVMSEDGQINGKEVASTGETNAEVELAMADYAVQGVEFTYLYCGKAEAYSLTSGTTAKVELVYEVPEKLRQILGLAKEDAYDMEAEGVANKCDGSGGNEQRWHYNTTQINQAMKDLLTGDGSTEDNKLGKDALEDYVNSNDAAVQMALTDANGLTSVDGLDLGLYLIVETKVPEEVVESVNPWFVTLPFTRSDGTKWLYDCVCYPKNQTGNPTLDKLVRNSTGDVSGTDVKGDDGHYADQKYNTIVSNLVTADKTAQEFAAERGDDQKTDGEYNYEDTTTASEGDVLDYILVSKIPRIHSKATYLTEYTFRDVLSEGIAYNEDARVAFYTSEDAAMVNDTTKAVDIWGFAAQDNGEEDAMYAQDYAKLSVDYNEETGQTQMTVSFTDAGLKYINENRSEYYIVIYYTGTVNSDATAVLGDEGNKNDVTLTWRRTSDTFYNTIEDRCYVYTFGLDLTKLFSDGNGDPTKVKFNCYNQTDGYYLVADEVGTLDGEKTYYVTGKTTDQAKATVFSPDANGKLNVHGVEGDTYQLTELETDAGYALLKDQIVIQINTTTRNVDPAVCGYVGNDSSTNHNHTEECYDRGIAVDPATGVAYNDDVLICGQACVETANGRTIEKIPMLVEAYVPATASVDGVDAQMTNYIVTRDSNINGNVNYNSKDVLAALTGEVNSTDGIVNIEITNDTTTKLPQTGGNGLYAVTLAGIAAVAGGCLLAVKRKKSC